MVTSVTGQDHTRHAHDADTRPGSTSTELQLRHDIAHSALPVETALTEVLRHSADSIRQVAQQGAADAPLTPEQIATISVVPGHLHESEPTASALDSSLKKLQQDYLTQVKQRVFNEADVLAYAKEAQVQRQKPKDQRDWAHADALWQHAQIASLPHDRKSGDMVASQIYISTANLSPLLTAIPAMMTLATKKSDLKNDAIAKAAQNFGVQAGLVGMVPLLMAFLRVMLLPAMENVRQGSPMRSKEMKTRALPAIVADMRATEAEMKTLTADMKAAQAELQALTTREEAPSEAFVERFTTLSERMVAASQKVNDLSDECVRKNDVDSLNDLFTTWRTRVGMLQVGTSFLSGVVGTATKDSKIAAGILVSGTAVGMLWNQGLSSPYHVLFGKDDPPTKLLGAGVSDDALKQDATILATATTSNILVPAARDKAPEAITMADIDLSDFKKQWLAQVGVGVSQVEEILNFNVKMKEQQIDDVLGLQPGESKQLETLEALPPGERSAAQNTQLAALNARKKTLVPESDEHAAFVGLRQERDELKRQKGIVSAGQHWDQLAPDIKKVLHDATSDSFVSLLRHTVRLGLVRMAQPSDFIPQVVQLVAAAVQLWLVAGRAFPLLVQAAFRLASAPNVEQGQASPIPDAARYTTSVLAAAIGVWGVMAAPHLIREKIAQRNDMRASATQHGERFGKRQNLHYKNLSKAAANLFHAMHISITGPLRQHRAAGAKSDLTREEVDTSQVFDQLRNELDRFHLTPD